MKIIFAIILACCLTSCGKKLDLKPDSSLVLPKTTQDLQDILNNTTIMNRGGSLPQISTDEYIIPTLDNFNAMINPITRAAYVWKSDLLEGKAQIEDWTYAYKQVFLCNNVIDIANNKNLSDDITLQHVKGWALFGRAYAFYNLVSTFSKGYNAATASTDLGIPLKLSSGITEIEPRSSVEETYNQIISDALESSELLQTDIIADRRNRPSKVAAFALLARVYLSMRKYEQAEIYADKTLAVFSKLVDYNTLPILSLSSFTYNSEETIYYFQNDNYSQVTYSNGALYSVNSQYYNLFETDDLRKQIYFSRNANGNYAWKGVNNINRVPFTGLASDEIYLIKAECLARRGLKEEALVTLNTLVKTRYKTGLHHDIIASSSPEALDKILLERKKALMWRSLRWTDLKRLNLENRNISLSRAMGGVTYTLEPNSPKYVMPIPDSEIQLSGIEQNIR